MQFISTGIKAMKAGRKTNTRRVQKEGERLVYGYWTWSCFNKYGYFLNEARHWSWADKPSSSWYVATILDKHGRIKWQVGRRYAIQPGQGKFGIGSFLCTSLRSERLQDISRNDVVAEGIAQYTFAKGCLSDDPPDPRWAFIELWDSIHKKGERWADNPKVWVIGQAEFQWKDEG